MEHEMRRRGEEQTSYQLLGAVMMAVGASRTGQYLLPAALTAWSSCLNKICRRIENYNLTRGHVLMWYARKTIVVLRSDLTLSQRLA
jgi:IS1 family transposase